MIHVGDAGHVQKHNDIDGQIGTLLSVTPDPTTFQAPDMVRAKVASNLADPEQVEGAALAKAARDAAAPPVNSVVILGDSITAHNSYTDATRITYRDYGFWTWAAARLGNRLELLNNAGVGGDRTDQVLARLDSDVLAHRPGWCVELSGTNDMVQGISVATAKANRAEVWARLIGAGIRVVAGTIPPFAGATADQLAFIADFNNWVRGQASTLPIVVVDYYSALVSPTAAGWAYGTADNDGVHPDRAGAAVMGKALADALEPLVPRLNALVSTNADPSQILVNGMMDGNASGVATGWALEKLGGGTTVAAPSKVPRTDGLPGEWQQFVVAPGNASSGVLFYRLGTGGLIPGTVLIADCEIEMDADVAQFQNLKITLYPTSTGLTKVAPFASDFEPYASSVAAPTSARLIRGVLRTPPLTLPAGAQNAEFELQYKGEGTIRVGRASIRAVS